MSWQPDYSHSMIQFSGRHMMVSTVRGQFEKFTAEVNFDPSQPEKTSVKAQIDAASLNSNFAMRDDHLRSADFLDATTYPTLDYVSKKVEVLDAKHARLIGDLTIRGVTHEVKLDVEYFGTAKSPWGATSAGFSASGKIDRKDWGLVWNQSLETGGWLVSDEIKIEVEIELIQQPEAEAEAVGD